jgi:hypothetical protein
MKRLLSAILLVTFLNGCAGLPLVSTLEGTLSINGALGAVTGKYETQAVSAFVNLASHESTGQTVSQHLYAAVENKYTKKRLEKHFKNKELSVANFEIANKSLNDFGGFLPKDKGEWFFGPKKVKVNKDPASDSIHRPVPVVKKTAPIHYIKLVNYTVLDKYAPNYKYTIEEKPNLDFTLKCTFSQFCLNQSTHKITFNN